MITMMGMLSSMPQMPHSHAQNSNEMNTAAEFMLAMRPVIHVVMKVPTTVAMPSEAAATRNAIPNESNCTNDAMPAAMAVTPGPRYGTRCKSPEATAQAPALSSPIQWKVAQHKTATSMFVVSS